MMVRLFIGCPFLPSRGKDPGGTHIEDALMAVPVYAARNWLERWFVAVASRAVGRPRIRIPATVAATCAALSQCAGLGFTPADECPAKQERTALVNGPSAG